MKQIKSDTKLPSKPSKRSAPLSICVVYISFHFIFISADECGQRTASHVRRPRGSKCVMHVVVCCCCPFFFVMFNARMWYVGFSIISHLLSHNAVDKNTSCVHDGIYSYSLFLSAFFRFFFLLVCFWGAPPGSTTVRDRKHILKHISILRLRTVVARTLHGSTFMCK